MSTTKIGIGSNNARLNVVQIWRFYAATIVVVSHAFSRISREFPESVNATLVFIHEPVRVWGHHGVDIFFVISGFIMVWTNWDRFGTAGVSSSFLRRRVARVVPIYWLATTLSVVLLVVAPQLFSFNQVFDLQWVVYSYLFIPTVSPGGDLFSPVIGLGWTLNYEMYFYLVFSIALLFNRMAGIVSIVSYFTICVVIGSLAEFSHPLIIQNTSWILLEFCLGMLVCIMYRKGILLSVMHAYILLVSSALCVLITLYIYPVNDNYIGYQFMRLVFWGIPCAGLLYSSLIIPMTWIDKKRYKYLTIGGDASYSIYLLQVFSLPLAAMIMRKLNISQIFHVDIMVLILVIFSIITGYVGYVVIEKPLTMIVNRMRSMQKARYKVDSTSILFRSSRDA